jgi:hypothetical protein
MGDFVALGGSLFGKRLNNQPNNSIGGGGGMDEETRLGEKRVGRLLSRCLVRWIERPKNWERGSAAALSGRRSIDHVDGGGCMHWREDVTKVECVGGRWFIIPSGISNDKKYKTKLRHGLKRPPMNNKKHIASFATIRRAGGYEARWTLVGSRLKYDTGIPYWRYVPPQSRFV